MTIHDSNVRAKCTECGFEGSLWELDLHSCDIESFGGHCEDYPCCGHAYGECQNRPEYTREYWLRDPHLLCDHEAGMCEVEYSDECADCGEYADDCTCGNDLAYRD